MSLYQLKESQKSLAKYLYSREQYRYPLITAIIDNKQDGIIFANNEHAPHAFFAIHRFGYGQIFGEIDHRFYDKLGKYLFIDKAFLIPKIRAYAPNHKDFFLRHAEISERCQFRLANDLPLPLKTTQYQKIINIEPENADAINHAFGLDLFSRFWRTKEDFLQFGAGKVVTVHGEFASICYAAATADDIAEIDVVTLPKFRQLHLGKIACSAFINGCLSNNIVPNWDCFTNNVGSMLLAKSLGFEKINEPYCFFTLSKK